MFIWTPCLSVWPLVCPSHSARPRNRLNLTYLWNNTISCSNEHKNSSAKPKNSSNECIISGLGKVKTISGRSAVARTGYGGSAAIISSNLFWTLRKRITIVYEGLSLTVVNEMTNFIKTVVFGKKNTCNFIECRLRWNLTVVGELKLLDIFLKTTQW